MIRSLNVPEEHIGDYTLINRDAHNFGDMLYSTALICQIRIGMNLGVSGLWALNASG
ncbi:MAG: hypothetical protein COB30_002870 [Ectothiorhodospiraceae bacterium]|nr:hypothetical protein [Ectothiorhodospiraceae bacterium]